MFLLDGGLCIGMQIQRCFEDHPHDWTACPFAHPTEKARRRDPTRYKYNGTACADYRKVWPDCRLRMHMLRKARAACCRCIDTAEYGPPSLANCILGVIANEITSVCLLAERHLPPRRCLPFRTWRLRGLAAPRPLPHKGEPRNLTLGRHRMLKLKAQRC